MATNFKQWVESPSTGVNVFDTTTFANDTQRSAGYSDGQTISAKRLNTILHQLSLGMVALFDQVCPDSSVDYTSSLADVKSALSRILVKQRYLHSIKISFKDNEEAYESYELTCTIESSDAMPITSIRNLFPELPSVIHGIQKDIMQAYACDVIAFPCKDHSGSDAGGQGFIIQYQQQADSSRVSSYYAQWSNVYAPSITDTVTSRW